MTFKSRYHAVNDKKNWQKLTPFYEAEFIKIITARGPLQKPRAKIITSPFFPVQMASQQGGHSTLLTTCLVLRVWLKLRIHQQQTYLFVLSFPQSRKETLRPHCFMANQEAMCTKGVFLDPALLLCFCDNRNVAKRHGATFQTTLGMSSAKCKILFINDPQFTLCEYLRISGLGYLGKG